MLTNTNTATKLNDSHMDQVLEVYETQTSNLRVKLTKNLDIYFRKAFETASLNKLGHSLWGHFDDNNMRNMLKQQIFFLLRTAYSCTAANAHARVHPLCTRSCRAPPQHRCIYNAVSVSFHPQRSVAQLRAESASKSAAK